MAIVTTNANTITGSATNTLGTLGRSIFNSTIGTFTDKDTMDQIYGAINKLNSAIETIDKTIDYEALKGRNKADDLFAIIAGLDIKSSIDLMNKNREFMKRLMRLNQKEKDITLNALGVDVTGESNVITNEFATNYEYTKGNNYIEDYVSTLQQNQQIGDETTTLQLESNTNYNYAGIHNDLYVVNQNLYPDDENKGTFANKWIVENRNSLLYKTKKLFNSNKINTIVSRFHTDPRKRPSLLDNAKSKYGLSHGRNLLTKQAEYGYNGSYANGYDNPYCRVWTHHHQYDRYYKTIRPFSHIDDQGNYKDTISVQDFHKWKQFSGEDNVWGWKKELNNGWENSVLQDNGKVNITPKYVNGADSNIHTKQCMFSIENLAWRGYDPYSFEQALSWEQRGPLGGRIMWFPPYGIQFNETTSTQWNNNTFLGRGEDVYTYANTTRTGTLSFMMVVDHPSIIDYVSWTDENRNVSDTDILRFLAGCGEGDGNGLRELAKPTPLTDEYKQQINKYEDPKTVETTTVETENITPDDKKPLPTSICFYVFYPNNYSGTYDDPDGDLRKKYNIPARVEPIPYLLAGKGAQKSGNSYLKGFEEDIWLTDDTENWDGNGYEMNKNKEGKGSGLGQYDKNYITGTSRYPNTEKDGKRRYWTGLGLNGNSRTTKYSIGLKDETQCKKWYYRIDGRYEWPKDSTIEEKSHYYNQTLNKQSSYIDTGSYGLNASIEMLVDHMKLNKGEKLKEGEEYTPYYLADNIQCEVFTLSEVAYVLYDGVDYKQGKCHHDDDKRINRLKELLTSKEKLEIESIEAIGFESSHGYKETNEMLGKHRAESAANWFTRNFLNGNKLPKDVRTETKDGGIGDKLSGDASVLEAKKCRYARVVVNFKEVEVMTPATSNTDKGTEEGTTEENTNSNNIKVSVNYNPTGEVGMYNGKKYNIFKDGRGKKWYKVGDRYIAVNIGAELESEPVERYGISNRDKNDLRYDQEYHFFKVLKQTDPVVYGSLMDKLQYFDPAFHSMTPEGFNGRLTFLQQCMRQGNTVSASDGKNAKSANNLAFGRAPYCVLRLGDFYNQMIIIDNLTINYDPLQWDLNVEGVGVQPLIANIQLSFKFIGGGDLTGPVRRLQNAMSFNYYANARLYDNRADRIERKWSNKTNGALENDEILEDGVSSFYTTQMYK